MFPWSSWRTLLPLLLGLAGIVGFVLYEHFIAARPLVALRIFKSRTAAVNYIGTVLHGVILWCMLYYLPLYYEGVKGYSATMTGVAIFPETFTVAPGKLYFPLHLTHFNSYNTSIHLPTSK